MFRRDTRRKPFVKQARKELDDEFAGAMTQFPSHNRLNPNRSPSIPVPFYKPHHLLHPPKVREESAIWFLQKTAGLSADTAHYINLQIRGKLHALLQMSDEEIKRDVRATYPWRSRSEYLKYTVTEVEFKKLFAALDKERAKLDSHDVEQFASNSDIQNPFFV